MLWPTLGVVYSHISQQDHVFATYVVPVAFLVGSYFILQHVSSNKNSSAREPPIAPYWIPYLGHLFGFLFDPGRLVRELKKKYPDSPFTLIMMGHKFHVYNSSEVIAHVFSRSREYLFHPIVASMMENGLAMPRSDQSKFEVPIAEYSSDQKESRAFVEANHAVFVKNLSGNSLTTTMREYSRHFTRALEEVIPEAIVDGNTSVNLHDKLERVIFFASLNTFFGKRLQADYPEIFDDFRALERALYVGVRSNLAFQLNPRAGKARARLLDHFDNWVDVELGDWEDEDAAWNEKWGMRLNWERERLHREHDFTQRGRSCSHASFLYVMNTNSGPLTAWFLTNILQSPDLLSRFQAECEKHLLHSDKHSIEFDLPKLRASPLVQGIWKESLRLGSVNAVARVVAKDIELKGYLLKQGSVVLIPVQLLHYNTDVFREPEKFVPERWIFDENSNDVAVKQKEMMAHLRPFGGGSGICSGRLVAEEEVILAAATLVMKYNFAMQNKVELHPMALGIMSPKKGVWVKMQYKK
ncbi:hypothetical protein PISL3812_08212 [Talaromyces islandicus]|uniref:Cytochrome P450 n=1 Tax=Talaromyces islandicus TaxID=28573 RepID=A0A0U1M6D9_TALIS|nr:hypothetical protein PISL3812_08212 [Talaromyces islandicus]